MSASRRVLSAECSVSLSLSGATFAPRKGARTALVIKAILLEVPMLREVTASSGSIGPNNMRTSLVGRRCKRRAAKGWATHILSKNH